MDEAIPPALRLDQVSDIGVDEDDDGDFAPMSPEWLSPHNRIPSPSGVCPPFPTSDGEDKIDAGWPQETESFTQLEGIDIEDSPKKHWLSPLPGDYSTVGADVGSPRAERDDALELSNFLAKRLSACCDGLFKTQDRCLMYKMLIALKIRAQSRVELRACWLSARRRASKRLMHRILLTWSSSHDDTFCGGIDEPAYVRPDPADPEERRQKNHQLSAQKLHPVKAHAHSEQDLQVAHGICLLEDQTENLGVILGALAASVASRAREISQTMDRLESEYAELHEEFKMASTRETVKDLTQKSDESNMLLLKDLTAPLDLKHVTSRDNTATEVALADRNAEETLLLMSGLRMILEEVKQAQIDRSVLEDGFVQYKLQFTTMQQKMVAYKASLTENHERLGAARKDEGEVRTERKHLEEARDVLVYEDKESLEILLKESLMTSLEREIYDSTHKREGEVVQNQLEEDPMNQDESKVEMAYLGGREVKRKPKSEALGRRSPHRWLFMLDICEVEEEETVEDEPDDERTGSSGTSCAPSFASSPSPGESEIESPVISVDITEDFFVRQQLERGRDEDDMQEGNAVVRMSPLQDMLSRKTMLITLLTLMQNKLASRALEAWQQVLSERGNSTRNAVLMCRCLTAFLTRASYKLSACAVRSWIAYVRHIKLLDAKEDQLRHRLAYAKARSSRQCRLSFFQIWHASFSLQRFLARTCAHRDVSILQSTVASWRSHVDEVRFEEVKSRAQIMEAKMRETEEYVRLVQQQRRQIESRRTQACIYMIKRVFRMESHRALERFGVSVCIQATQRQMLYELLQRRITSWRLRHALNAFAMACCDEGAVAVQNVDRRLIFPLTPPKKGAVYQRPTSSHYQDTTQPTKIRLSQCLDHDPIVMSTPPSVTSSWAEALPQSMVVLCYFSKWKMVCSASIYSKIQAQFPKILKAHSSPKVMRT